MNCCIPSVLCRNILCVKNRSDKTLVHADFLTLIISVFIVADSFQKVLRSLLLYHLMDYGDMTVMINSFLGFSLLTVCFCCCYLVRYKGCMALTLTFVGSITTSINCFAHPSWATLSEIFFFFMLFSFVASNCIGLCTTIFPPCLLIVIFMFHFLDLGINGPKYPSQEHMYVDLAISFYNQITIWAGIFVLIYFLRWKLSSTAAFQNSLKRRVRKVGKTLEKIVSFEMTQVKLNKKAKKIGKEISSGLSESVKYTFSQIESLRPFLPEDIAKKDHFKINVVKRTRRRRRSSTILNNSLRSPISLDSVQSWDSDDGFSMAPQNVEELAYQRSINGLFVVTVICVHFFRPVALETDDVWHGVVPRLFSATQEALLLIKEKVKAQQVKINFEFNSKKIYVILHSGTSLVKREDMEKSLAILGVEFAISVKEKLEYVGKDLELILNCEIPYSICVCSEGPIYSGIIGFGNDKKVINYGKGMIVSSTCARYCQMESQLNIRQQIVIDRKTEVLLPYGDYAKFPCAVVDFPQYENEERKMIVVLFMIHGKCRNKSVKLTRDGIKAKLDGMDEEKTANADDLKYSLRRTEKLKVSEIKESENSFDLVDIVWDLVEENRIEEALEIFNILKIKTRGGDEEAESIIKRLRIIFTVVRRMNQNELNLEDMFRQKEKGRLKRAFFKLNCIPVFNHCEYRGY